MRLRYRAVAAVVALLATGVLAGCQGNDLPAPPNGPNPQSFSTNNALLRIVNGAPGTGTACNVAGQATFCIDIFVDGKLVAAGVPYPTITALNQFAILPYISVPGGQALIQIYKAGTTNLIYGLPVSVSAGKKYSFVITDQAPIPPGVFNTAYLFNDGLFNSLFGNAMGAFHNGSPNAGSLQFSVTCASCGAGQPIGNPAAPGTIVGPVNLVPSTNYSFNANNGTAKSITAVQLNGLNTSGVIPDPRGKPNVSIYAVDTATGGAANYQLIGVEDSNG